MNTPDSLIQYNPFFEKIIENEEGVHLTDQQEHLKEILENLTISGNNYTLDTDTLLKIIIPPKEWTNNGRTYIQYVSNSPSSREDVVNLQKLLDERLSARQAKETGICPIREELHSECFDEIIRQVTIDCPERGVLLMRSRDELKMTINAYKTLYNSAVSFGMRKQMESEIGKKEIKEQVEKLKQLKIELDIKKKQLINKKMTIEKRNEERRIFEKNKRKNELEFLEYQNTSLRQFFQNIDSGKS